MLNEVTQPDRIVLHQFTRPDGTVIYQQRTVGSPSIVPYKVERDGDVEERYINKDRIRGRFIEEVKFVEPQTYAEAQDESPDREWLEKSHDLITNLRYRISHGQSETAVKEIDRYWQQWREACDSGRVARTGQLKAQP